MLHLRKVRYNFFLKINCFQTYIDWIYNATLCDNTPVYHFCLTPTDHPNYQRISDNMINYLPNSNPCDFQPMTSSSSPTSPRAYVNNVLNLSEQSYLHLVNVGSNLVDSGVSATSSETTSDTTSFTTRLDQRI